MSSSVNRFVSDFVAWARRHRAVPQRTLARLPKVLRRAIDDLESRDTSIELRARDLGEHRILATASGPGQWLFSSGAHLWVVAATPHWWRGWSSIDADESVSDLVGNFFHFAAQYVGRARMANLVGSVALAHRVPFEFRYVRRAFDLRVSKNVVLDRLAVARAFALEAPTTARTARRTRLVAGWVSLLNCLDPYLHRMIYQYLRALKLEENGHYEEAVTAMDGVVAVALQFARERLGWNDQRDQALLRLVGGPDAVTFERLYQLRCAFGAHPSCGKWWDFSEIYETELDEFPEAVTRLIRTVAELEREVRVVESDPTSWSAWFHENCHLLWRSVWFDHVP